MLFMYSIIVRGVSFLVSSHLIAPYEPKRRKIMLDRFTDVPKPNDLLECQLSEDMTEDH